MTTKDLKQTILNNINAEAIARDTLEFIKVKSETGREGEGSLFLAELMRREGFDVELDEVAPGRPNVTCRIAGSGDGPSLLLNGHTDTIPIGKSSPPERDGDWVVGRGAEDMKGGLVAMLHAASALQKCGIRLKGDLWLTGVIDHETPAGKKQGPRRLIEKLRSGSIRADAIVIVEGPRSVWAASLGSSIFNVTIQSELGPIHTIKVPFASNPARWAGRLLEEFARLEAVFASSPPHPLCGREQINVGIVRGGDYVNRLPTPVEIMGTWRWQPGKAFGQVKAELQDICDRLSRESGLTLRCTFEAAREPFDTQSIIHSFEPFRMPGSAFLV